MTQRNRFKRVKHGQEPGDLPKKVKIAMREGKHIVLEPFKEAVKEKHAKAFRKIVIEKGKTKERQRGKKEIARELSDD